MEGNLIPALLIDVGPRSLVALGAIVIIIAGVWFVDREWDERGSKAYYRTQKDAVEADRSRIEYSKPSEVGLEASAIPVVVPQKDLDKAFVFPWAFLLGWAIFAASYLSPAFATADIVKALLCCALGFIASVPMGDAVKNRKAKKKKILGALFVFSWSLLAIFTGLDSEFALRENGIPAALCIIGAFTIIASMQVLWRFRKMGDTWEQEGRPNPQPVVYNMGGPLFVVGFFLFWLGKSATEFNRIDCAAETTTCGLPIFLNYKSLLAVFAGCGMVPIVMMVDFAHDEGGEYVGFGTSGASFGRFFESPVPFISMWVLFGMSSFFDLSNEIISPSPRSWAILAICTAQGIVAGLLIQTALYKADMRAKTKWAGPFVVLFLCLAVVAGFKQDLSGLAAGGKALGLGLGGAALVVAGQKTVFADRKRGDYFMEHNGRSNPNPIVYSAGEPLFMAGWIAMSLALTLTY